MPTDYAPCHFLRHVDGKVLQYYFSRKRVAVAQNWDTYNAKDAEALFAQLNRLPNWSDIQSDFLKIHSLANANGMQRFLDELYENFEAGKFQYADYIERACPSPQGFYGKAFCVLLEYPEIFESTLRFAHVGGLPQRYWRKYPNIFQLEATEGISSQEAQATLKQGIGDYYHQQQGRGSQCKLDVYEKWDF